jgi:hypothetical protein
MIVRAEGTVVNTTVNATTRARGMRGWTRLVLLAVCCALLAGALPARGVDASQSPQDAAKVQELVCNAFGGVTDTITRIYNGAVISIRKICKGGLLDGMDCTNYPIGGTKCSPQAAPEPDNEPVPDWVEGDYPILVQIEPAPILHRIAPLSPPLEEHEVDRILAGLEAGLSAEEILARVEPESPGGQDVAPRNDHASDPHKHKGKKRGHGKKHGKARKR